jgi:DedD protein
MSHLLDDDDDDLHGHQNHRELTLSTGTVLGIFLGLALSWALFFGFGYNMGSKARQAAQPAADASNTEPDTSSNFKNFKPSPGSPVGSSPSVPTPSSTQAPVTAVSPTPSTAATATKPADAAAEKPAPAAISLHPTQPAPPPPATNATGTFVVQVAAVSHQEDAGYLVNALRGKGYTVNAVPGGDNLIHVQVGPFNNRKEADSMRQQLLSDGYNAIVK